MRRLFKRHPIKLSQQYQDVFRRDPEAGEAILTDLLAFTGFDRPSYVQSSGQDGQSKALEMAFREGQKSVLYRIFEILNYDDDYVTRMSNVLAHRQRMLEKQMMEDL